jgi:hypothetical protein
LSESVPTKGIFSPGAIAAVIGRDGHCLAALCRDLYREFWRRPLHVRKQFPVDKGACSYPVLFNAFKRLAAGASVSEKADLFAGTASQFYRLEKSCRLATSILPA